MNKLVLDYSKWRCGGDGDGVNKLGEGTTQLLNTDGFLCCLGQFSLQLEPTLNKYTMSGLGEPVDLDREIPLLSYTETYDSVEGETDLDYFTYATPLSDKAIAINDDPYTTPEEKIKLLRELFGEVEYEIEVINKN